MTFDDKMAARLVRKRKFDGNKQEKPFTSWEAYFIYLALKQ